VKFAVQHNLKVSIKSTGHDFLGRSTAKGSLLLWTHYFRNVSFTESFKVGGKDLGSAVTVGSGVRLNELYSQCREAGKFVVSGNAATVATAGGYIQGGGHSAFSPAYGLAADNALRKLLL
jgi:FAD/FMN-containing dehydrogenase